MSKCTKSAIAIASHPDDIEFMMSGTLLRLRDQGYEIHYMNIANGSLGTCNHDSDTIIKIRRREALKAAKLIGAVYHESICEDMEVFYTLPLLAKVVEVIRQAVPEVVLTHGPYDYMEDHINAGKLAVAAAFCRGMTNFKCSQAFPATLREVAVYHAMPHSFLDQLNRPVMPDFYIDVTSEMPLKREMLACHQSQKDWLDTSQGAGAYLDDMTAKCRKLGEMSGQYTYAEGWIRHNPVGFGAPDFHPLRQLI